MYQYFENYIYWEDYINGMYDFPKKEDEILLISLAIEMLTNNELFLNTCKEILIDWTISSRVNLTNKQCNRKAWLGQAACNYKFNVPEILTRIAWGKLSDIQKYNADAIALKIINHFELSYENKNNKLY